MEERSLLDLVSFIVDNRGRSCPVVGRGFPLIATNCVTDASRRAQMRDVRYVSEETYTHWFRSHPQPNDVLFVCKGNAGRVALVPDPVPYCIAQDMVALRADPATTDPVYLYYRLSAPDVRYLIEGMHVGTLIPHFKKGDFGKLRFPVHSLPEQRRIAGVLGALDDLIETNRQQISRLRDVAQACFESAARDGDEIPFGDVAQQVRQGVSRDALSAGTPYLGLEHFGTEGAGITGVGDADTVDSNKSGFTEGDVLYGKLRPYFRKYDRPGFSGVCSTEIWVLRGAEPYGSATVSALVARPEFTDFAMQGSGGTRMPRADWKHVASMPVAVPAREQLDKIEPHLDALWLAGVELQNEAYELTRTRDELLPLLMSGRVRVREVA